MKQAGSPAQSNTFGQSASPAFPPPVANPLHRANSLRTLGPQHHMSSEPDPSLTSASRRQPLLTLGAVTTALLAVILPAAGWFLRSYELSAVLGLVGGAAALASVSLLGTCLVNGARARLAQALLLQTQAADTATPHSVGSTHLLTGAGADPALLVAGETRRLSLLATWGQAAATLPFALLALAIPWLLRPTTASDATGELALGVTFIVLSFPLLLLERRLHSIGRDRFSEAPALARLLRLGVWTLVVGGAAAVGRALDVEIAVWAQWTLLGLISAVAAELVLRIIIAPFIPVTRSSEAQGLGDSLITALLLTRGHGGAFGHGLKERFGIDLAQSWAVRFLRRAALPLLSVLLLIAWLLSGLTALSVNERGVYERFGAPVAVFQPGMHLHLPWPCGVVHRVEFGQVHELALGNNPDQTADVVIPLVAADADTPAEFDRLWDRQHPSDATYLVPGDAANGGRSTIGYQLINCDVRVLWRVGMEDANARNFVYQVVTPVVLVREQAQRLLQRSFASRSLAELIGDGRDGLADGIRAQLQAELDTHQAGIQVTAVVIDAIHPPMNAVPAYHGVQAAEIAALTEIARARGQAAQTTANAQRDAAIRLSTGQAIAGEAVATAHADTTRFDADRRAFAISPQAMRLERWLQAVSRALGKANLVIVDHRLILEGGPTIDLRKYPGND